MRLTTRGARLVAPAAVLTAVSASAAAYVGPGPGITFLGALAALAAALLFAIAGVVLWPLRTYLRRRRERAAEGDPVSAGAPDAGSASDRES